MPQNQRKIDQMLEAMRTNGQFLARLQVELGANRSWVVVYHSLSEEAMKALWKDVSRENGGNLS